MRTAVTTVLLSTLGNYVNGQFNLVPNPSFEEYVTCPNLFDVFNSYSVDWFQPTWGTPDQFNSCAISPDDDMDVPQNFSGYQNPLDGEGYAGIFAAYPWPDYPDYREYIEVKLINPLLAGVTYHVNFFVSLGDSSIYSTDDIGLYFSVDSLYSDTSYILDVVPQIEQLSGNFLSNKSTWTKISGSYIASGGEVFLTIGNFKRNNLTDTLFVDGVTDPDEFGAYYFIDQVCVSSDSLACGFYSEVIENSSLNFSEISLTPNPSSDHISVKVQPIISNLQFVLLDLTGRVLVEQTLNYQDNSIDLESQTQGIYVVKLVDPYGRVIFTQKLIIKP